MLRVATSVRAADGRRAVGTYIPARGPDGTPSPVLAKVLAGERFSGRAFVVDAWYVTTYEPIRNAARGGLRNALRRHPAGFARLHPQLPLRGPHRPDRAALRAGRTRRPAGHVRPGPGRPRGWRPTPPTGTAPKSGSGWRGPSTLRSSSRKARRPPGSTPTWSSPARRTGWSPPLSYFAPWDWVVVAEMDEAELKAAGSQIWRSMALAGLLVLLAAVALTAAAAWLARRSAAPDRGRRWSG